MILEKYSEKLENISKILMEKSINSLQFRKILKLFYRKRQPEFYIMEKDLKNEGIIKSDFYNKYLKYLIQNNLMFRSKRQGIDVIGRTKIRYLYKIEESLQYFFDNYGILLNDLCYYPDDIEKIDAEFNDLQKRKKDCHKSMNKKIQIRR